MRREPINRTRRREAAILVLLLASVLFPAFSGKAQWEPNDLLSRQLKGRVKTVAEYEAFYSGDGRITKRNLRGFLSFDAAQHLVEAVEIIDRGDDSYYNRYRSFFDAQGRRTREETYVSSKGRRQDLVLPDLAETNVRRTNPIFTEKLFLEITRKFNARGDVGEETIIDAGADTTLKSVYLYKKRGALDIFTSKNGRPPQIELRSVYKNNRRIFETTHYRDGVPEYKTVVHYDRRKRLLYREQFSLKKAPGSDRVIETLVHRTNETGRGRRRETENFSFGETGVPISRALRYFEDGLERSQIVYKFRDDAKRSPFIYYQTRKDYEFDEAGSWTKYALFRKDANAADFLKVFSLERIISYY